MELNSGTPQVAASQDAAPQDNLSANVADVAAKAADQATPAPTPTPAPQNTLPADHPTSLFHNIMETLGGGPKRSYKANDNGEMQETDTHRSGGDIAKSILAGALTGLFASAGQRGPGASLRAFGAGGQAVQSQRQQADAMKRQQAQQDFQNKQEATMRQAQIADSNSRTILNTMQAEKLQGEALDEYVDHAAPMLDSMSSLADANNLSQSEIMAGLQSGKYHTTNDLFIPDGKTAKIDSKGVPVKTKEGMPEMEITYTHVKNGPVPMTQDIYDEAAAAGLPKFTSGTKVAANQQIPASQLMSIQQQIAGVNMAQHEVLAVRKGLGVKDPLDWTSVLATPGMSTALMKFQGYMHAAGDDPMVAIQQMSAQKPNKNGVMVPNPDAKFSGLVTQAFGGGDVLRQYHDQLAANADASKTAAVEQSRLNVENNPTNVRAAANADATKEQAKLNVTNSPTNQAAAARGAKLKAQAEAEGKNDADQSAAMNMNLHGEEFLATLPPSEASTIRAIGEGREEAPPMLMRSKDGRVMMNKLNQAFPGWDQSRAKAYFDTRRGFETGKEAQGINHLNTALQHMGKLYAATTFSATFPGVSGIARHLGDTNAKKFDTYKKKVGEEIEAAYTSGALTNMDKKQADSEFNEWTPFNARAGEKGLTTLLVGKLKAYQHQWEAAKPSPAIPDFPVIQEENVGIIKRVTGEDVSHLTTQASRTTQPVSHTGSVPPGGQSILRNGQPVGYILNGVRTDF